MATELETAIHAEALKLIRRHEQHARWVSEENVRRARRTTARVPPLEILRPSYWGFAAGFDPYLVRARTDRIGHSIRRALRSGAYAPRNPTAYEVLKGDGSTRTVSVFQVADNAVSKQAFQRVMEKNRAKLSSRSYAYRPDLTAHDALQYLAGELDEGDRMFIAEYDFSKYFETIEHDHIRRTLADGRFLMTAAERRVVEAFMTAPLPVVHGYREVGGSPRERGLPQGTSISLFLANVAASSLDRSLERLGVGFVRYADDTILWSPDYSAICRAVDELHSAATSIGSNVNLDKSPGVRLLVKRGASAEIASAISTDFVGYRVAIGQLEIKSTTVERAKARIRELIYFNLLEAAVNGTVDPGRLAGRVDRDYVVYIWQLRRFLYGDLSERDLRRYHSRGVPMRRFKGFMSYYPLADDTDQLRELDGWLAQETWLAMPRRAMLLRSAGSTALPPPHDLALDNLVRYRRKSATTGGVLDLRLPSFRRMANVVRSAAYLHGPNRIGRSVRPYDY